MKRRRHIPTVQPWNATLLADIGDDVDCADHKAGWARGERVRGGLDALDEIANANVRAHIPLLKW